MLNETKLPDKLIDYDENFQDLFNSLKAKVTNQTEESPPPSRLSTHDINTEKMTGCKVLANIKPFDALNVIKALPLVRYKLRHDTKQEIRTKSSLSNVEMRLIRNHVGVIDVQTLRNITASILHDDKNTADSIALLYINLRAITHITNRFLHILESFRNIEDYVLFNNEKSIRDRIQQLQIEVMSQNFTSLSMSIQDYDTSLIESKQKAIALLRHDVKRETRRRGLITTHTSQMIRIEERDTFLERNAKIEDEEKILWELEFLQNEAEGDIKAINISMSGEIQREYEAIER